LERLVAIKARYDPTNLFRLNRTSHAASGAEIAGFRCPGSPEPDSLTASSVSERLPPDTDKRAVRYGAHINPRNQYEWL
jgi:hypothetical protein